MLFAMRFPTVTKQSLNVLAIFFRFPVYCEFIEFSGLFG